MTDYTEVFNRKRIEQGKEPTTWMVVGIHEGMQLPCGCKIHNASNSHFSVYHNDYCKSAIRPHPEKEVIGRPMTNMIACFIVSESGKIIALTNPTLGLWPHEVI